jgi:hypothetical protein
MNILKDLLDIHEPKLCAIHIVSDSFSVGDYVFVSKYGDAYPNDPWHVGIVNEIGIDRKGTFIRIYDAGVRTWRNAVKIDKETGDSILSAYANYR